MRVGKQLETTLDTRATTEDARATPGRSTLTSQLGETSGTTPTWEATHPLEIAEIQREPGLLAYLDHGPDGVDPAEQALARSAPEADGEAHEVGAGTSSDSAAAEDAPGAESALARSAFAGHSGDHEEHAPSAHAASAHAHAGGPTTPDDPARRHDAPYEHKMHHAKKKVHARSTPYSSSHIHSHRVGKDKHGHKLKTQVARPGVRYHGKDVFELHGDAPRYRIANGSHAAQVDTLLASVVNSTHVHHHTKLGERLCVNATHSRDLYLGNATHKTWCVLTWMGGGHGPAWLPVHFLKGKTSAIRRKANALGKLDDPRRANVHHTPLRHYRFRAEGDPIAVADAAVDRAHFMDPHQRGVANHDSDYLQHTNVPTNMGGAAAHRSYINVCLNLPSSHAPAVAGDVAVPGDQFFVAIGSGFRRSVPLYRAHKWKPDLSQVWVYGFCGKQEHGRWVADQSRPGWVPLRVLDKV